MVAPVCEPNNGRKQGKGGRSVEPSLHDRGPPFWGLRGAGPNFGVATSFEFRLHPVGPMLAGRLVYPLAQAREVFHAFHEITQTAP